MAISKIKRPPGPKGNLITGNLARAQAGNFDFMFESRDQYGDILYYRIALWYVYRLGHPDFAQRLLQDNHRNYNKQSIDYNILRRVSGNGLISSEGAFWLRQRRLMQPLFHRKRIHALGSVMTEAAERMLGRWGTEIKAGEPLDVAEAMTGLTMDIVSRALFSLDIGETAVSFSRAFSNVNEYLGSLDPLFVIAPWLPTAGMNKYRAGMAELNRIIYGLIAERRANPLHGNDDMLTLLIEAQDEETGERMTDEQIRDETITLLIAGHETTANALAWTWYLLAQHPEQREELERELEAVLAGRVPTMADIPQLVYTEKVIKESMRLYPPAWFISRTAIDWDELAGYPIPPKSFLSISTYLIHHHPDFWPEPFQFDPERFDAEQEKARPRYAYIPFGGGPRMCIGNHFAMTEAILLLATIAQHYRLDLAPGQVAIPEPLITLRPKGGLPMLVTQRIR
jgi:cytochrome P450